MNKGKTPSEKYLYLLSFTRLKIGLKKLKNDFPKFTELNMSCIEKNINFTNWLDWEVFLYFCNLHVKKRVKNMFPEKKCDVSINL